MLVEEVEEGGSIDRDEGELLRSAIEFTEREADDIRTHRTEMEAVSADTPAAEVARRFAETKFSRIPVYEDTIDNIIGVIHLKDLYTADGLTTGTAREILSPAVFVRRNERISAILKQLQKAQSHIAVVLDEYGGTYGIVTMEDILEELVGEIWDEHDETDEDFRKLSDSVFRVQTPLWKLRISAPFSASASKPSFPRSAGGLWSGSTAYRRRATASSMKWLRITVASLEHHRPLSIVEARRNFCAADA